MQLLVAANRRHFQRHPLQLVLAILGIALGVAMWVSVDLAIESARRAFTLSTQALTGTATHHLVGAEGTLDEAWYARLRREYEDLRWSPVVEGLAEAGGQTLHLLGLDPLAETDSARERRRPLPMAARAALDLLDRPDCVLLSARTATRLGIEPGAALQLEVRGQSRTVTIVGYPDSPQAPDPGLEGVLIADIATAQELLGKIGRLDRIDVTLPAATDAPEKLRQSLPEGLELVDAAGRATATARMSRAFEINLEAMSLLALLVGVFLIYNTMSFTVLQRRPLLADLRLIGATPMALLLEVLQEAGVLGILGSVLGLGAGLFAAEFLLERITRTINDVYYVLTVTEFSVAPAALVRGLLIGIAAAVLAALPAALEAAAVRPSVLQQRSMLERGIRRRLLGLVGIAAAVGGLGAVLLAWPDSPLPLAIAGLFFLLAAYALLTPAALVWFARGLGRLPGLGWRLAVRGTVAALSRTGAATAALSVAVATALGVGLMVESFRVTVAEWLAELIQADVYLAQPAEPGRPSPPLPTELLDAAGRIPGVVGMSLARRDFVESAVGRIELLASQPAAGARPGLRIKDADADTVFRRWSEDEVVLISEPFANRHGLAAGAELEFATPAGPRRLLIAGVFFDYRSDQGLVLIRRELYQKIWGKGGASSLGLYLAPGVPLEPVRAALQTFGREQKGLSIRSNREIREASMEVFRRTFAITHILRLLALGVAFIGITSAFLALELERGREFAVLRAIGMTPGRLARLVLAQTGFLGLAAGLFAIPLGLLLAQALVTVINLRSFGWTMALRVAPDDLFQAPLLAVAAALIGGAYPAFRATRTRLVEELRAE